MAPSTAFLVLLRTRFFFSLLVGALGVLPAIAARADERAAASTRPARSIWLAPTYQLLLSDGFEPASRHGFGVSFSYEFHFSPKFNLGLGVAYRIYPGDHATHQLGYGAILKHFFSREWSTTDGVYPFVDYGLLLQQSFVNGRKGNAVSHDTRLGAGVVLRTSGLSFYAGLAGHYSRLQYFEVDSKGIPYLDAQIGWLHPF